jgi:peptide/nickel transport system ATP-binding protein
MSLLVATDLARIYQPRGLLRRSPPVRAVDGVSFSLSARRTLGLVGESGSGKSTTGRLALGIEPADQGKVRFAGADLPRIGTKAWRKARTDMQMVFQNPLASLDRRMTILQSVAEPLSIHDIGSAHEHTLRVGAILDAVGLGPKPAARYPHELSGGQLQRAVLARALVTEPRVLVCDEPVSALDVSIQAQVVNKLIELQRERGLAILFISHDLRLVRQICDEVAVMYLGRIVEQGTPEALFHAPLHPYTSALVSAVPKVGPHRQARIVLSGDPPNPAQRPTGCAFHPRCSEAVARCRSENPALLVAPDGRKVACHLAQPPAQSSTGGSVT